MKLFICYHFFLVNNSDFYEHKVMKIMIFVYQSENGLNNKIVNDFKTFISSKKME